MTSIVRLHLLVWAIWLCGASVHAAGTARDSHDDDEEGFEVGVQCNEPARRLYVGDLREVALTRCEERIDLYRVAGPCPAGFARRISISWSVARPEVELSVLREWYDQGGQGRARTESRVIGGTVH